MANRLAKARASFILPIVLFIVAMLVMIGFYVVESVVTEGRISVSANMGTKCFYSAEAGIQDAIYQIQYDPTARDIFLNTPDGVTTIPLKSGLADGSSYKVTIKNTAKAAATITATGYYQVGPKQAQRQSTLSIVQASVPGTYNLDAALFVGGSNAGDIDFTNVNITHDDGYAPSSLIGSNNINFKNTNINMSKDILANQNITNQNSTVQYGGILEDHDPTIYTMPMIDVTSDCAINVNSYKCLAKTQNQYYTSAQFAQLLKSQTTFDGIVYVAGDSGVNLTNKNLTVNGTLVSEGTVSFTNASLDINHTSGPSGLITLKNLNITNAVLNIEGLVYIGIQASLSTNANITVTGAILAHQFSATNIELTLNFKPEWAIETLMPDTIYSPVIQLNHWEEEY